jgi:hypothetical protein
MVNNWVTCNMWEPINLAPRWMSHLSTIPGLYMLHEMVEGAVVPLPTLLRCRFGRREAHVRTKRWSQHVVEA